MPGALLEVQLRERDLEVKIVKAPGARGVFGGSKCFSRGRRRDLGALQNTRQAQEFLRVAKTLAGVVDLKRVWNDAFCVASAGISCSSRRRRIRRRVAFMFRKCYLAGIISCGSYRSSHASARLYWNSEAKCLVNMSFLKEVSAEKLRFWASKLHFWRKSRRKASFLSFKEVSQNSFICELQSFISKEVSQKSFVFELQTFNFWRKSRRKALFLSFKAQFLKEVSQKRKSLILLNPKPVDNQTIWIQIISQSHQLNLKSIDNQLAWIWNQLRTKIMWITHRLTTKSFEFQIIWHPNHLNPASIDNQSHLNLKSDDNQITWISNQMTTSSLESQINWQQKSLESHIGWQSNPLNLESIHKQIPWMSTRVTTKSLESQTRRQPNRLTFNSFRSDINWLSNQLKLHTPSSYIGSSWLETFAALCGRYVVENHNPYI